MNTRILSVLLSVMPLCFSSGSMAASNLKFEIEKILNTYIAAEETQDPGSIMKLMSRDPGVTSVTDGKVLSGWAAIQHETELAAKSHKPPNISLDTVSVRPLGEDYTLAIAEYTIRVHLTRGPVEIQGAWTVVFERANEEWTIFHEHHSHR